MTAVAGATFTAAAFNQHVRDNLNETAPAKATAPSQLFVSTGPNVITTRVPSQASIATRESTTSSSYTDLTTAGPSVSVTTGTTAFVWFAASQSHSLDNNETACSVAVSGASTVAASNAWQHSADGVTAGNFVRGASFHIFTGLNPGTNTFTMKYRVGATGTASFRDREIAVLPL
jgi:cytoskeletal protein RodZ